MWTKENLKEKILSSSDNPTLAWAFGMESWINSNLKVLIEEGKSALFNKFIIFSHFSQCKMLFKSQFHQYFKSRFSTIFLAPV